MGQPIDGRVLAASIRTRITNDIKTSGLQPGLAVVLVGDDPASHLYVRLKEKACAEVGIRFEKTVFSSGASEQEVTACVRTYAARSDIHGILVQLPLPPQCNEDVIIAAIPSEKDVDGFHPENVARLERGQPLIVPGLAKVILALVNATGQPLDGATVALLANSSTFCRPIEALLHAKGARTTRYTPFQPGVHPASAVAAADIVVSALGCGGCIDASYVKPGAVLIDVGIAKDAQGKICGDFGADAQTKSEWYTPVPGGVGPMTVAMLLENVVEATKCSI